MSKINFQTLTQEVSQSFQNTAQEALKGFANEALQDAQAFLKQTEANVQKWLLAVEAGEMTQEEFAFLLETQKNLARMKYLTQKGVAKIQMDRLKDQLVGIVFQTAIKMIFPVA